MKSRLLHEADGLRTFAVVMDKGDEAVGQLLRFLRGVTARSSFLRSAQQINGGDPANRIRRCGDSLGLPDAPRAAVQVHRSEHGVVDTPQEREHRPDVARVLCRDVGERRPPGGRLIMQVCDDDRASGGRLHTGAFTHRELHGLQPLRHLVGDAQPVSE
jgi:hypothetical protein